MWGHWNRRHGHKISVTDQLKRVLIECWAQLILNKLTRAINQLPKRIEDGYVLVIVAPLTITELSMLKKVWVFLAHPVDAAAILYWMAKCQLICGWLSPNNSNLDVRWSKVSEVIMTQRLEQCAALISKKDIICTNSGAVNATILPQNELLHVLIVYLE